MIVQKISNTKPSVFFLLYGWGILYVFLYQFFVFETPFWPFFLNISLLFLNLFLINRMARKTEIGENNYYSLFFSVSFFVLFPQIFSKIVFFTAFTLVVFAFERLLHVRYHDNEKEDIFLASLLFSMAGLLFNWVNLYFLVIVFAVFLYTSGQLRNLWIFPLAWLVVLFLVFNGLFLFQKEIIFNSFFNYNISFFEEVRLSIKMLIPLVFLLFLLFLMWILSRKKIIKRTLFPSVIYIFILVSVVICVVTHSELSSEIQLFNMPFSLFSAVFFDRISSEKIKEKIAWLFLILPVFVFFLHYFIV